MQDDLLYKRIKLIKPEPNYEHYYNVGIHSDGDKFYSGHMDENYDLVDDISFTVSELADLIRMDPDYNGGPVRLVACFSGRDPDGPAQQLANELGVSVRAPDMAVFIDHDGQYRLARNRLENGMIIKGEAEEVGEWHTFEPKEV